MPGILTDSVPVKGPLELVRRDIEEVVGVVGGGEGVAAASVLAQELVVLVLVRISKISKPMQRMLLELIYIVNRGQISLAQDPTQLKIGQN